MDVQVLRAASSLNDVLGAVQRQVSTMIENAQRSLRVVRRIFPFVSRLKDLFIRSREEHAQLFTRHLHVFVEEVGMARGIAQHQIHFVEEFRFPLQQTLSATFRSLPLHLFKHLLIPCRNHRIEGHRNAATMRPTASGHGVALTCNRHPNQVRLHIFRTTEDIFEIA